MEPAEGHRTGTVHAESEPDVPLHGDPVDDEYAHLTELQRDGRLVPAADVRSMQLILDPQIKLVGDQAVFLTPRDHTLLVECVRQLNELPGEHTLRSARRAHSQFGESLNRHPTGFDESDVAPAASVMSMATSVGIGLFNPLWAFPGYMARAGINSWLVREVMTFQRNKQLGVPLGWRDRIRAFLVGMCMCVLVPSYVLAAMLAREIHDRRIEDNQLRYGEAIDRHLNHDPEMSSQTEEVEQRRQLLIGVIQQIIDDAHPVGRVDVPPLEAGTDGQRVAAARMDALARVRARRASLRAQLSSEAPSPGRSHDHNDEGHELGLQLSGWQAG